MTEAQVWAEHSGGRWIGVFRVYWKVEPIRVTHDGKPICYTSSPEAQLAAWQAKYDMEEPHIYSMIIEKTTARAAAEQLFKGMSDATDTGNAQDAPAPDPEIAGHEKQRQRTRKRRRTYHSPVGKGRGKPRRPR